MFKYFCSSDIHSFYDEWIHALQEKGFDITNPEHRVIVCGDLFDRGEKSVECLTFMRHLCNAGRGIYIRGNHEDLLFECVDSLNNKKHLGQHHISNGTIKTISQITGVNEYDILSGCYDRKNFNSKISDILSFIEGDSKNYFQLGSTIFVHGWIPCYQGLEDFRQASKKDWEEARWDNGMEMWKYPRCRPEGKTVVCGHWHCSWGWSHIRQKRKEFPQKNHRDWEKSFEPFIDDGIVAIDACTAYTDIVNVCVFDENGKLIGG